MWIMQMIRMKCEILFSLDKEIRLSPAIILLGALKVRFDYTCFN